MTLRGNIRAAYEEDYQALDKRLKETLNEIEAKTGTRIELEYPKPAVLPFANDPELTRIAETAGRKIFGEQFLLEGEEQLFLSGAVLVLTASLSIVRLTATATLNQLGSFANHLTCVQTMIL